MTVPGIRLGGRANALRPDPHDTARTSPRRVNRVTSTTHDFLKPTMARTDMVLSD